ncbi:MAG: hypothetical protein J1E40_13055 [Oscillospiraceae bacterium]|nr:hypothetical protein [Oscillospiraceae bacterium]
MVNMIKADFYRISKSMVMFIALAFVIFMAAVSIYFVEPGSVGVHYESGIAVENELNEMSPEELKDLSTGEYREIMLRTEGYALDRDVLAANINLYYVFIFAAAVIITVDFSGSCVKNTLSSAISRRKYFFSKLATVFLCCLVLFFMNTYIIYFGNIIFNGDNLASDVGTVTKITLLQIPPALALTSILTGFAFILRKTAVFNTLTIPFMMIVQLLMNLISAFVKIPESAYNYELQRMITLLAFDPSKEYILKSYAVCAVIIVLFNLAGWLTFKKAEIK